MSRANRRYIQNKDGTFAGSVSTGSAIPQATPKIPSKLDKALDRYEQADAAEASQHQINKEVVSSMENFIEAMEDYARENEKSRQERLDKMDTELKEVSAKLDATKQRLEELMTKNAEARHAAEKRNRNWFTKLFR